MQLGVKGSLSENLVYGSIPQTAGVTCTRRVDRDAFPPSNQTTNRINSTIFLSLVYSPVLDRHRNILQISYYSTLLIVVTLQRTITMSNLFILLLRQIPTLLNIYYKKIYKDQIFQLAY